MPQKDFSLTDAERCVIITKWDIRFIFSEGDRLSNPTAELTGMDVTST